MASLYKDSREGRLAPYAVLSHVEITALQTLKRLASVQLYLQLVKVAAGREDGTYLGLTNLLKALSTSKASLYRALKDLEGAGLIRRNDNVHHIGTVVELIYPSQSLTGETESLTGETPSSLTGETIPYTPSTIKTTITPLTPQRGEPKERISKEREGENEVQQLAAYLVRNWDDNWNCEPDRRFARIRHFLDCFGKGIDGESIKWFGTKRKRAIQQAIECAVDILGDNATPVTTSTDRRVDRRNSGVTHDRDVLIASYEKSWGEMFTRFGYMHFPEEWGWKRHTVGQYKGERQDWTAIPPEEQKRILEEKLEIDIKDNGTDRFHRNGWQ